MKALILSGLIALIAFSGPAQAQTVTAAERFAAAQAAFDDSQYEKTLTLLDAIEQEFGQSPRVESLRALVLRDLNRPRDAYESLLVYFRLTEGMDLGGSEAHRSLVELRDRLKAQLEGELLSEKEALQRERDKEAEREAAEAAKSAPTADKPSENPLAEIELWNRVKESTNPADYYLYIQRFPDGAFVKAARRRMNELGDPEWDKIKGSKDPFVFRDYLKNNPESAFAEQARARMNMLAESIVAWERIRESRTIADFRSYAAKFPDGPHAEEADKAIETLTFEKPVGDVKRHYPTVVDWGKHKNTYDIRFTDPCVLEVDQVKEQINTPQKSVMDKIIYRTILPLNLIHSFENLNDESDSPPYFVRAYIKAGVIRAEKRIQDKDWWCCSEETIKEGKAVSDKEKDDLLVYLAEFNDFKIVQAFKKDLATLMKLCGNR